MLYEKPKGVTYTQMAIWVDDNAYKQDCDETTMFQYLYFLCYMLAKKKRLYNHESDYDDFSAHLATWVYMRYRTDKRLPVIKSCLNYIRKILYYKHVGFDLSNKSVNQDIIIDNNSSSVMDVMHRTVDDLGVVDFSIYLDGIVKTIRRFLCDTLYYGTPEFTNIYTSCLLSLINYMTFSKYDIERYKKSSASEKEEIVNKLNDRYIGDSVVLYHLNDDMHDYILVLLNEIRHMIAKDLSDLTNTYIPSALDAYDILERESNED